MENSFLFDHPGLETGYFQFNYYYHTHTFITAAQIVNKIHLEPLHCVQRVQSVFFNCTVHFFSTVITEFAESERVTWKTKTALPRSRMDAFPHHNNEYAPFASESDCSHFTRIYPIFSTTFSLFLSIDTKPLTSSW